MKAVHPGLRSGVVIVVVVGIVDVSLPQFRGHRVAARENRR